MVRRSGGGPSHQTVDFRDTYAGAAPDRNSWEVGCCLLFRSLTWHSCDIHPTPSQGPSGHTCSFRISVPFFPLFSGSSSFNQRTGQEAVENSITHLLFGVNLNLRFLTVFHVTHEIIYRVCERTIFWLVALISLSFLLFMASDIG